MTKEQYEKYSKLKREIEPVRKFLYWCGDKYQKKSICKQFFSIFTKGKQIFLYEKDGCYPNDGNTYELPLELQKRIVKVVEDYFSEKEKELEEI